VDPTLIAIVIVAAVVAASGVGRALTVLGRSSDVMASLFVPPDRSLGWPHGVQEQDVAWSWRPTGQSADAGIPPAAISTAPLGAPVISRGPSLRRG
jgi:hypothetical protein